MTNKTKQQSNFTIEGNLAEAAELRHTAPNAENKSYPVIEFRVAVNASRDKIPTLFHNCQIFVSEAHMNTIRDRLQDTKTRLKISGDQVLEVFQGKDGEYRAASKVSVTNAFLVTLEKGKAPVYQSLFHDLKQEQQAAE